MQRIAIIYQIIISILIISSADSQQSLCGDYVEYRDEKCFKLMETLDTYENAIDICKKQTINSTLVSIGTIEEQAFIENLLRDGKLKPTLKLWIGAKRSDKNKTDFVWQDNGSSLTFTNWYNSSSTKEDCVEMLLEDPSFGKWITGPCLTKNLFICQFSQINQMKKLFASIQKQMNDIKTEFDNNIQIVKNISKNPVPIGFIYTQLPYQSEPSTLWPTVNWTDVSNHYSGLFFRVLGANSSEFNSIQDESSPRLESVEWHFTANGIEYDSPINIPSNGGWSKYIYTAGHSGEYDFMRFKVSSSEVRPKNQAIKVWKRIS